MTDLMNGHEESFCPNCGAPYEIVTGDHCENCNWDLICDCPGGDNEEENNDSHRTIPA